MSQCGIHDVPAKRITDAFSKVWAQHGNASAGMLRRALATELTQRANDPEGLARLRAAIDDWCKSVLEA